MSTKRAGDIMVPLDQYPHIPHWFTLRQAVAELEKCELEIEGRRSLPRSLLVFDEKYQLLGVARRRDIMRGLEPKFLQTMPVAHRKKLFDIEIDPNLVDLSSGAIAKGIREMAERPVSEIMQPIAAILEEEDHLAKVIYKMISHDMNLLPVLKDDIVVGVVRSVDVFHEIANIIL